MTIFNNLYNSLRLLKSGKKKFNIGSAGINPDNSWFATDKNELDITKVSDWRKYLIFFRLDNIFAEHVWEHLSDSDTELANKNCFRFLKKNGVLRLAVPDGFNPDKRYIDYVRPGGNGIGADDHKILYNYKIMKDRLEKIGFEVELLEYWDEFGQFNFIDWSNDGGRVERSKRYDLRNKNGSLSYTSLIVDAIKR
jgi:predicted SAM-dependent methyltransferase